MQRRTSLKILASTFVGAMALGHWSVGATVINAIINNPSLNAAQHDLLVCITDTILPKIPTQAAYGALELGVPIYLIDSLVHCEPLEVRENLITQLDQLEHKAMLLHSSAFADCERSAREALLLSFAQSSSEPEKAFFAVIKQRCIRGYLTSQAVMTQRYHYQVIPGHYKPCIETPSDLRA